MRSQSRQTGHTHGESHYPLTSCSPNCNIPMQSVVLTAKCKNDSVKYIWMMIKWWWMYTLHCALCTVCFILCTSMIAYTLTHTNKWTGVQVSNYRGVAMYCIVKYIGNSILLHWIVLHCTVKYITVEKLHCNDGTHTVTGALGCRWVVTEERHSIALWNVLAIPYHYIELSWVASILQWKNYTTTKAHTLAGVQVSNYWWEAPPMSALACISLNATHCIVFSVHRIALPIALSCITMKLIAPPMCALACVALNASHCIV